MAIILTPPPNVPLVNKTGQITQQWLQWFISAINAATTTDATLVGVDTSLTTLDGQVTALDGRADTLETDVTAAQGDITALQSDVAAIDTALDGKQPLDATLTALAATTVGAADLLIYSTGADLFATTSLTAFMRGLLDDGTAGDARTTLGLGTMATQAASGVAITGGSVTGITDLAVADGGTGASDASGARTNLGLVIGTNVQAYDAELAALAGLTSAANKAAVFTGSGTAALVDFLSGAATTYTPTVTFATPGNLSVSYTTQDGWYYKAGRLVFAFGRLRFTPTHTTASGVFFFSLPFTVENTFVMMGNVRQIIAMTFPSAGTQLFCTASPGTSTAFLQSQASAVAATNLTIAEFPTATARWFDFSILYVASS